MFLSEIDEYRTLRNSILECRFIFPIKGEYMLKILRFTKRYLSKSKSRIITYLVLNLLLAGAGVFLPYITGLFIDRLLNETGFEFIWYFIGILISLSGVAITAGYYANKLYVILTLDPPYEMQLAAISHMQNTSVLNPLLKDPSYLNHRINNDANMLIMFSINFMQQFLVNSIKMIIAFALLFILNPVIAISLAALNLLYGLAYRFFQEPLFESSYRLNEIQSVFFTKEYEQLSRVPFLQLQGLNKTYRKHLEAPYLELKQAALYDQKLEYWFLSVDKVILLLANIVLFSWGGFSVMKQTLSIGQFTIVISYFNIMMEATKYYFTTASDIPEVKGFLKRMEDVFSQPQSSEGNETIQSLERITLHNISFAHTEGDYLFHGFNYDFDIGNIYILKGPNGSGKSTLIKLILGIYESEEGGDIKYNGLPIQSLDMTEMRRTEIGVCEQEPSLLSQSICYNLTFDESLPEETSKYINLFQMDAFFEGLEEGIETLVEDDNLSGGEKQKIALIRTLLKNPKFLFLDEPTSALDSRSKNHLIHLLKAQKNDRITIISTHDEDLLQIADEVIELR